MLIQGLEELRRKDLNIRALEKTQQRLASTLSQLERDTEVCILQKSLNFAFNQLTISPTANFTVT